MDNQIFQSVVAQAANEVLHIVNDRLRQPESDTLTRGCLNSQSVPGFQRDSNGLTENQVREAVADQTNAVGDSCHLTRDGNQFPLVGEVHAAIEQHLVNCAPTDQFSAFRIERRNSPVEDPTSKDYQSAASLKRSFNVSLGHASKGKKLSGECDPENREIYRLRQDELLDFEEIASALNRKRVRLGISPSLTSNAVYSRYKRNAPLIAASEGRAFVPTALDQKPNGETIRFKQVPPIIGFNAHEDRILVRAVEEVEARKWELVAARLEELGGHKHEPDMCARRYQRI